MPVLSTAQIKNYVRRSFKEMVDPSPDKIEIEKIWDFFESRCAYCNKELKQGNKEAHIDHLISASKGGGNNISNRVLSCANCNEKEKLDQDWEIFLNAKCSAGEYKKRSEKIKNFILFAENIRKLKINQELMDLAIKYADEVNQVYEKHAKDLKQKVGINKNKGNEKSSETTKKYLFDNCLYGKNRLVLAVVKKYVLEKSPITFQTLKDVFPKSLQGSHGVFADVDQAKNKPKRYFQNQKDIVQLQDKKIAVCNQWFYGNIDQFINHAKKYGYTIIDA